MRPARKTDEVMGYEAFKFEVEEGVAHVTFNQAERDHPIDLSFATELSGIANECGEMPGIRCVMIDSSGKYFGVDADLKMIAQGPTRAFNEIKNLLLSTSEQPIEAQLEIEARATSRVRKTEDAWTGITDVAAKRTPRFSGR